MKHDEPTRVIVEFAASVRSGDLRRRTIDAAVRHHLDTVGCGLGGMSGAPAATARAVARTATTSPGCSVYGVERTVAPEQAVFANGTMVRQLEFNDSYSNIGGGHPSDMIPAIFAAAEISGSSGLDLVCAIHAAYEVFAGLAESYGTVAAGWDQGLFVALGAAIGAGVVFGFEFEEFANALSMALVPAMSLRCTRSGELSSWKICATPHAAMTGLLAARLARNGMTGPSRPFDGPDGFHHQVPQGKPLAIGELRDGNGAVERTSYKYFPAELHSQTVIEPLAGIREQCRIEDIEKISIETYHKAWYWIGGGHGDHEEKWNPTTPETADHSLAYVAAISLLDGEVTHESFSRERIVDPGVRLLMDRITVSERADLTALWPNIIRNDIVVELRDGRRIELVAGPPVGHPANPMSDEHLRKKFARQASHAFDVATLQAMENALWSLDELPDLDGIARLYRSAIVSTGT